MGSTPKASKNKKFIHFKLITVRGYSLPRP
jgi:hypothetical protein